MIRGRRRSLRTITREILNEAQWDRERIKDGQIETISPECVVSALGSH